MVRLLYFSEALLSFICLIVFIMIWVAGTRYWFRLLIYNKQVNAKLVDTKNSKDKHDCYGIFEYNYKGKTYRGTTMDKVIIRSQDYYKVYLCSLFPNKICTEVYKEFS